MVKDRGLTRPVGADRNTSDERRRRFLRSIATKSSKSTETTGMLGFGREVPGINQVMVR